MKVCQDGWQAQRHGRLHSAKTQTPVRRRPVLKQGKRFVMRRQYPLSILHQGVTGRGEPNPSVTIDELGSQFPFQFLDVCGDVGLHRIQPLRGGHEAARLGHRQK